MITFDIVVGNDVKKGCIVFDWENNIYEFLIEEGGNTKRTIFGGDIASFKEVLKKALEEIERNEKKEDVV